jgi:ABC-type transport system involved in cytochrome c biogenesis permease component
MSVATAPTQITNLFRPGWSNWRLALLAAVIIIPLSILVLPIDVAFWVSLAAAAAVATGHPTTPRPPRSIHHGGSVMWPWGRD